MTPSTHLRVDHFRLRNFRCFAECTIELHDQLTVLVAENGQGIRTAFLPLPLLRKYSPGTRINGMKLKTLAFQVKAKETLRVFNINPQWGRLRNMRKAAVAAYVSLVDGCTGFSSSDLQDFFRHELAAAAGLPFFTAIRHVLTEA